MDKRVAKRYKRENRASKKDTWFCAGCRSRHRLGEVCPVPRLKANSTHGSNSKK